jgi:hypothetical protein
MLHWICPECGRECEPTERDCAVCYPVELAATARFPVVRATAYVPPAPQVFSSIPREPDPPPVQAGVAVAPVIPQFLLQTSSPFIPPLAPAPVPIAAADVPAAVEQAAPPPLPASVMPPPLPEPEPDPASAGLVQEGLRALSENMRAWDDPAARRSRRPAEVLPIFAREPATVAELAIPGKEAPEAEQLVPRQIVEQPRTAFSPRVYPITPITNSAALNIEAYSYEQAPAPVAQVKEIALGTAKVLRGLELAFDPALLEVLEQHEQQDKEWDALEAAGLCPRLAVPFSPVFRAFRRAPILSTPHAQFAPGLAARQTYTPDVLEDLELRTAVSEYNAKTAEEQSIDQSVGSLAGLAKTTFIPTARVVPTSGILEAGGFCSWPIESPKGLPVPEFAIDVDLDVRKAVYEYEVAEAQRLDREFELLMTEAPPKPPPVLVPEPEAAPPIEVESPIAAAPPPPPPATEQPLQPEPPPKPEAPPVMALTLVPRAQSSTVEEPEPEVEKEDPFLKTGPLLIPIVESSVPPMAKSVAPPYFEPTAAKMKIRPRRATVTPSFTSFEPHVPPRLGKKLPLIASPLLSPNNARRGGSNSLVLPIAIGLLIPITALGVLNYWILPAQRASAASAPVESTSSRPEPPTSPAAAAAPANQNWRKQIELSGLRLQDSTVRFIAVNHAKNPSPALTLSVTLRSASARATDSSVGTFQVKLSPIAAGDSRDMSAQVNLTPPIRPNMDWVDLRADIQAAKP